VENLKIKKIIKAKDKTSDITVRNNNNFFANNFLMHNCFYAGEVHVDLHNVGNNPIVIKEDTKLAQMVIIPVVNVEPTYTDELYVGMRLEKERGEAGFGSTDK